MVILRSMDLRFYQKCYLLTNKGIIAHYGRTKDYDLEKNLPLLFEEEIILSSNYYNNGYDQDLYSKELENFMTFYSRLQSDYLDTLGKFIEYKFELCEKSLVAFKIARTYQFDIFIYALKIHKEDINYILGLANDA